jgi:hypothetical protein
MASVFQRKKHFLTFPQKHSDAYPEFLGPAKIGGLECCYFKNGKSFPKGRYEFELTTLTIPAGFAALKEDGSIGVPAKEAFVMPFLADMSPEGSKPNFASDHWHYCNSEGADLGTIACAWPIGTGWPWKSNALKQIVFFYDDSERRIVPRLKTAPDDKGAPRDPNHRYFFAPMLLPNQNICYYLLPESTEQEKGIKK